MMTDFMKVGYNLLRPGGRFLGFTINFDAYKRDWFSKFVKYGIVWHTQNDIIENGERVG